MCGLKKVAWIGTACFLLTFFGCFESSSTDSAGDEDLERDIPTIVPNGDADDIVSESDGDTEGEDEADDVEQEEEESGGCIDPGDEDSKESDQDSDADPIDEEDGEPPCECTEGSCCTDGCHFDSVETICDAQAESQLGCPDNPQDGGEAGCGKDLYNRYRPRFCSGNSAACEGELGAYAEWTLHTDCTSMQRCDSVELQCVNDRPLCDDTYCNTGECCDLESETFVSQGTPCGQILGVNTEYRCSGTACGADLEAREYRNTCTGISSLCEGEAVAGPYEIVQNCTDMELCDLQQLGCVSETVCGNDFCDTDAPCCDMEAQRIRGADAICETEADTRVICSGNECGADLQQQTADRHCSGISTACDGILAWGEPNLLQDCDTTETCDAGTSACLADRPRCDPSYCEEGLCCDTETQTLKEQGTLCREESFTQYDCSEQLCGAQLSSQLVERHWNCTGTSAGCDGSMQESLGDWQIQQTCSADEICLADEGRCEQSADCAGSSCPDDMVDIGTVCIDRYEASRQDATVDDSGSDDSIAVSRVGVMPWYVNPITSADVPVFTAACEVAGKRMCTPEEWFASCTGSEGNIYVFGNTFNRETCNCVDTYCDDYCLSHGISLDECNLSSSCGYSCGEAGTSGAWCFRMMPTGSFPDCVNEYGAFDINGNLWEIIPVSTDIDSRGFMIRGGAFNCAGASARLQCTYNAGWTSLYAGFRCCKDRETAR